MFDGCLFTSAMRNSAIFRRVLDSSLKILPFVSAMSFIWIVLITNAWSSYRNVQVVFPFGVSQSEYALHLS